MNKSLDKIETFRKIQSVGILGCMNIGYIYAKVLKNKTREEDSTSSLFKCQSRLHAGGYNLHGF
jgi:hypothetical protein